MALKPQQLEAIDLHMAGETYPEIAFRLGVSARSVERWASSHEWKLEVSRRLESRREASIALEKQATAKAWEVVLAVLDSGDPRTQLDAAKFLISRADRLAPPTKPGTRSGGLSDDTAALIRAKVLGLDPDDDEDFEEIWNRAQNAKSA